MQFENGKCGLKWENSAAVMGMFDILKCHILHLSFMNEFVSSHMYVRFSVWTYMGVADLPLCCELNLGNQVSSSYFRSRHRKHRQGAAPVQTQTQRHPSHWVYTVQTHWRQHHWKKKTVREKWERSKRWVMGVTSGGSTIVSPSVLPGWHRGADDMSLPRVCAVMIMQKVNLTEEPLIPAVQLVLDVVQVNVFRELFVDMGAALHISYRHIHKHTRVSIKPLFTWVLHLPLGITIYKQS